MSTRTVPCCCGLVAAIALGCGAVRAGEALRVTFAEAGDTMRTVEGRLLVEAADGGLLVEDRAGAIWTVTPEQLRRRDDLPQPFVPLDSAELAGHLVAELGDGFTTIRTRHYVICTSAPRAYAEWCGALFERLLRAFVQHWERAGLHVRRPDRPLPAIVFATQQQYADFAARDAGPQLAHAAGYYSIRSNCIVLYDLTTATGGAATGRTESGGNAARSVDDVSRRVAAAPAIVATIVHEATHQIAFNSGMHTRYADNPMWLVEGMAMYFETPDLRTGSGWNTIGRLNTTRLRRFRDYASRRDNDSLASLVSGEERFRDPERAADAYAEAWALTYFLIRTRREEYVAYLHALSARPRLRWATPDERLAGFEAAFGNLQDLERAFVAYAARLGGR